MTSPFYSSILKAVEKDKASQTPFSSLFSEQSARSGEYKSIFTSLLNRTPSASSGLSESILKSLRAKPRVFVSYHHGSDGWYYREFSRIFSDAYDVCHDNSVDRLIDSDDSDYVMRMIREEYLTNSSCTVVLCGAETRWRKFVDWEIKATLDKQHSLIGVNLPTNPCDIFGRVRVPDRLHDNLVSGFASFVDWGALITGGPDTLRTSLQVARLSPRMTIRNERALRKRNG